MKRSDIIVSLVIGEAAALLMVVIIRNLEIPSGPRAIVPTLPFWFPIFTFLVMAVGSFLGRWSRTIYQLAKFGLVGGLNFLIDLGTLNLLIFATAIASGFYANAFKALSFLVAVISSYLWNKFWTFHQTSIERTGLEFFEFFVVSAIGLGVNVGVFAFVNDVVGPQFGIAGRTWASIAAGAAAIVGLLWNFVGYKFIVFRRPQRPESRI